MKVNLEKISDGLAKITVDIDKETFLDTENKVFNKQKSKFNIPGFRKGHVTKDIIFKNYGRGVLFEDTANEVIRTTYYDAASQCGKTVISTPEIDITKISEEGMQYTATVAIIPEFKLGKYKGIKIPKTKIEVSEEDINNRLNREQMKNSRLVSVDREIKDKDIVKIDFEGFVDGKTFKGGSATDFQLTIGSHSFIDTFEEQLIGHKVLDDVEVNVKFPTPYQEKTLEGKDALFKVKIKEVKERQLPEIDDEFVSEISEFENLKDFKDDLKKQIEKEKSIDQRAKDEQKIVDKILEDTKLELDDRAIETELNDDLHEMDHRLRSYQKITLDDYLKFSNTNLEDFKKERRPIVTKKLKSSIILDKIGKEENIEASDEKVDKYIEDMAVQYGMDVDKFKSSYMNDEEKERIRKNLYFPAVLDFVYENADIN